MTPTPDSPEGLTVEELAERVADLLKAAGLNEDYDVRLAYANPIVDYVATQVERLTAERDEARAERQSLRRNLWDALDPDGALYDDDDANTVKIIGDIKARADTLAAENERLLSLINTPRTDDWMSAVALEAAHQQERWGSDHDVGKTAFDWFWLLGYLGQKAADAQVRGDVEKAKHHTISTGAALLNWHRALTGESTAMRPGIEPSAALAAGEPAR